MIDAENVTDYAKLLRRELRIQSVWSISTEK